MPVLICIPPEDIFMKQNRPKIASVREDQEALSRVKEGWLEKRKPTLRARIPLERIKKQRSNAKNKVCKQNAKESSNSKVVRP